MSYRLLRLPDGTTSESHIIRIADGAEIPISAQNRDGRIYLSWLAEGNVPLPPDEPTQEELDREKEIGEADKLAKQWFKDHPAAIDFVRLTPEEQEVQIDAMTTDQLKTLLKFLTIAVSAIIKRRHL